MPVYGPYSPASGFGSSWVNANNVDVNDSINATYAVPALGTSNALFVFDFSAALPTDGSETIVGILVEINAWGDSAGFLGFVSLFLLDDSSTPIGDDKAPIATLDGADTGYISIGGATDMWGAAFDPAMANDAESGVQFAINNTDSSGHTVFVDHVRITFYTELADPPQIARPTAVVAAGSWTAVGAGTIPTAIDETTFSDADYAESADATGTPDEVKVRLGALVDPAVGTGHIVRYRYKKKLLNGDRVDLTVTLYRADGTTSVATQTINDIEAVTSATLTLSGGEADSIPTGDYATGLVLGFKEVKV